MVFGQFLFGLGCGITLPFMVHKNIYEAMVFSFYWPHLRYRQEKTKRDPNLAIPVESLDRYVLDVGKSTLLFFALLGPIIYRTYWAKDHQEIGKNTSYEDGMYQAEDSYTTILKKMKEMPLEEEEQKSSDSQNDQEVCARIIYLPQISIDVFSFSQLYSIKLK